MTREGISTILLITGMILPLAAWKNFRKPGVPFVRFAPLHTVSRHLHPIGTALYWGGLLVIGVGLLLRWAPL